MGNEKTIRALALVLQVVEETIREAGDFGIPSGTLYVILQAHLPQVFSDVHRYNAIIEALVASKRITNTNHLLRGA